MHKLLFNTGVRFVNRPFTLDSEEWVNGTLHKVVYLESEPPKRANLIGLCDTVLEGDVAIPVVGGETMAKFAVYRMWPAM